MNQDATSQPTYNLTYPIFWQGICWLLVGIVVWLSLIPLPPTPPPFPGWDKIQHISAYSGLMFWFRQSFERHWRWPIFLVCLGIGLEFLQEWGGARTLDPFDMLANGIGVLLGLLVCATPLGRVVPTTDAYVANWGRPSLS